MKIMYSNELSNILSNKINGGLLPQCKRKSLFWGVFSYSNLGSIQNLLSAISDVGGISRPFTFGITKKSPNRCWLFLFDMDENSAVKFAKDRIVRRKVPHKVRTRMVLGRIEKASKYLTVTRELLTYAGLTKAKTAAMTVQYGRAKMLFWLKRIEHLLERDDMDQALFDEAWDLWRVQQVMAT